MKIFLENLRPNMNPYNGKGKFVQRLAAAFNQIESISVVSSPDQCDVNICFNKLPDHKKGKQIVRLDNVTYSNEKMQVKTNANLRIKNAIQNADGIIYQSTVAKNICETILDVTPKKYLISGNGVDPKEFKSNPIPLNHKVNFLIACQFLHPLRRIDKVLKCWNTFSQNKDDAHLYIFYDKNMTDLNLKSSKSVTVGPMLKQNKLNEYIKSCDSVILSTYRDSCPNLGAEALACGTPLIINKNNGLCEYMNDTCGVIVDVDGSPEIKMESWTIPPFTNENELLNAFDYFYAGNTKNVQFPDVLDIKRVAEKYVSFFRDIL